MVRPDSRKTGSRHFERLNNVGIARCVCMEDLLTLLVSHNSNLPIAVTKRDMTQWLWVICYAIFATPKLNVGHTDGSKSISYFRSLLPNK